MLVLTNFWLPHSVASILSALSVGYRAHVVVSEEERDGLEWLHERAADHGGRLTWQHDTRDRPSKAAHTLTRFDYLPEILKTCSAGEHVLVTDADVVHQRPLEFAEPLDVALWRTDPTDWLCGHIDRYAAEHAFPLWWSEFACTTMAVAMVVAATEHGLRFANWIKWHAESLRQDGFGDRWGVDQVAIYAAERHLAGAAVQPLNANGRLDVSINPGAAIWYPHPHQRDDPDSPWSQSAALWRRTATAVG